MNCLFCKGELEDRTSTYMLELEKCIVIVKNVPSHVCAQCGEVSYDDKTFRELERIVEQIRATVTEIAIVNYSDKTA